MDPKSPQENCLCLKDLRKEITFIILDLVDLVSQMKQVNIHEAKTHLSKLLEEVRSGEEIIISKAGLPIAKLVPILLKSGKRKLGLLKGQVTIAADFDSPLPPDLLAEFEGSL